MRIYWAFLLLIFSLNTQASKLDSLKSVLEKSNIDSIKFKSYSLIINELINANPSEAEQFAKKQLEFAKSKEEKAKALLHLGLTYDYQYKFDEGIENYYRSLSLYTQLNDSTGMAKVLLNLGIIYYYKGDLDSAIYHYVNTLAITEKLNLYRLTASALGNLGAIHRDLEEFETALKYERRSLEMDIEANNLPSMAASYNNIGLSYRGMGNHNEALNYYKKALDIRKKINDKAGLAVVLTNIGQVYYHQSDFKNALKYNLESLEFEEQLGNEIGIAESKINIGECYLELGDIDKSVSFLEEGLNTADKLKIPDVILAALEGLGTIYATKGWYDKAYIINKRYATLQDSLFKETRMKQIKELEAKYNTEKAEKENEILKKENTINHLLIDQKNILERNLFIGLVLLLLILALVFYAYRTNKNSNKKLGSKNRRIQIMNNELQTKNKAITDSILYAKRIQEAILPQDKIVKKHLENSFVLYRPKDIVSGDFYWMTKIKDSILFAAVDCTGHGVPGAFMSIVGNNGLNKAVNEQGNTEPSQILNILNRHVVHAIQTQKNDVKDGMDIAICNLNLEDNILKYGGAYNPLYLIRDNELTIYKGSKQPIGDARKSYTQEEIELQKGDVCYIFTDGYADQFGGEKNKKFNFKRFKQTLMNIHSFEMDYQKSELERIFDEWKGNEEQLDDICIIGFKI